MGKTIEKPRYCVLSGRFSEDENTVYRQMARDRKIPVSDMVREGLSLWKDRHQEVVQ